MRARARDHVRGGLLSAADVEAYLRAQIPLSAGMDIRVLEAGPDHVSIEAPLSPNLNHRSTAFGGSVAAVAILTGWTLVHLRLGTQGSSTPRTVIQSSSVRFDAPVHGAFRAVCGPIGDVAWDRFVRALSRHGKGRVSVEGRIESGGRVTGTFRGAYVAIANAGDAG